MKNSTGADKIFLNIQTCWSYPGTKFISIDLNSRKKYFSKV